ncbi:MAG: 3-oxoadipate enol-lactonase, partial [Nocardioides sp.]|nr:3-oxoadipate enol-lactonase [Nocardioides sp.]
MSRLHHEVTPGPEGAPAVVLSNSLGSTLAMWDRTVPALEEHFTVVRYDTRGHGASDIVDGPASVDDLADDVIGLIDELSLERVHFVG